MTTSLAPVRRSPESVQPVAAPAAGPAEITVRPDLAMNAQRSVEKDAQTGSLVYRLVDVATGFVAVQTPSESRLRLRAYIDGVTAQSAPEPALEVTA
ncbi:hypothetical protein [Chenggangzhangella methanolivorans]|uniref:Flagellar protein FlaG n=2 Tax=Chenggangzhangella methanolivorans TaxID=1437009 RepID=A0A9E6RBV4_9HYPH|nr:hypothetical protein [Chenggangzhangella methanolivorans]QZO01005.1 hypothetical protein K6K41_05190 [Chenggangzhangella methanolivorans]